jgi:Mor family transcriptional regulator
MIEELIALLGNEAFAKLACVFGGAKLYVGKTENQKKKLTIVIGNEAAKKLVKAYAGGWIDVPKDAASGIDLRNKNIVQDCDANLTLNQLASKYELSQRQICNILKKHIPIGSD